ncbi:Rieske (2Fe-2S) protein [Pseudohongiella sp. SYSU M77423]|uniref:Rieske (2Fe-2S) protein n=1 Tax=unclassified Pseudohongiella TaxID=2629611 RepID=UPI000C3EC69F|nr:MULTISPECIES: Rieske (2Fe-2S) protein [unclassified Pseudohongiella]MAO41722.1 (2Fe-2S)-binding protein [Pseudohongiella sp.]MAY56813.1 (2Fe-2S)-binding protein [Gammaproteobacteria bacterium]MEC8858784.1 Rieske (2Fe-2S) protein [Pseudomonadota bacterium]MBJ54657.1 (2Fe-2S)-binding protein [Gammaproteobacteria bacterium]MDH7944629.1 Rieske (2Fe-2S) protein [Pseudohongiella sp. SYSU M77423]|tara:strand:+ start:240 stop:584 length:345 start_codon:yes stop_codon:yes gene_type:complete
MITLCHQSDIEEGRAKGFDVNGKQLFAVKKDEQLFLYYNYCPHLGTPLEWLEDQFLDPDGVFIQCATHGALFQIENGQCIQGPCKGKSLKPIPFELGNGFMMVEESQVALLGRL